MLENKIKTMNLQKYASVYADYHKCHTFHVVRNDTIVLPFTDMKWEPWLVLRLHKFDRISVTSRLAKSLSVFFNSEAPSTTFIKQDTWTLLIGSERVVFPKQDGKCKLYSTPYFVSDPRIVDEYLRGSARPVGDNIYTYKNTILYLDPCDVPYPGGCYYSDRQTLGKCKEANNNTYRLCFLSREPEEVVVRVIDEWKSRQGVTTTSYNLRVTIVVPSVLNLQPVMNVSMPDQYSKSTGTIHKHIEVPTFLIQDILMSFLGEFDEDDADESSSNYEDLQVRHLGLIMEWPFYVQYEGGRRQQQSSNRSSRQYVGIAVNGSHPKNVLLVREPYERYVEYDYVPRNIQWLEIYFVREGLPATCKIMSPVVLDSVVIGFKHGRNGAFFCLSHPLLEDRPRNPSTHNMDCLLTTLNRHPENDPDLLVLETFNFDSDTLLHRVRISSKDSVAAVFQWDLWCLSKSEEDPDAIRRYPKRVRPPHHTEEYLQFYAKNKSLGKVLGNVPNMQIATILAQTNICYKTRIVKDRMGDLLTSNDEIVFQMERPGVDFLNNVRLKALTSNEQENQTEEGSCIIL